MKKDKRRTSEGRQPTFFERACTKVVINLFDKIEQGGITCRFPDGSKRHFGDINSRQQARMTINDHRFFRQAVLGGDIGLGEAYMQGLWDTDDIPQLFGVLIKNRRALADGHLVTAWLMLQKDRLMHAIGRPYGMILVTGPTGSGKTVSLYTCLNLLNKPGVNIATAEDPSEINLPGVNQVNVNEKAGLTFAAALKSFLRQDPDIIMVGEIRDFETAEIAVKAALTGHMVLSTLHTNDAPSTISRMLNMGVEPFLITASVNLVLAQRLARRVCKDCATASVLDRKVFEELGFSDELMENATIMKGAGCRTCNNTGYKGRVALYEVMRMTENLREMVLQGAPTAELKVAAIKNGMISLRAAGNLKIAQGVTTPEEVLRVTMAD